MQLCTLSMLPSLNTGSTFCALMCSSNNHPSGFGMRDMFQTPAVAAGPYQSKALTHSGQSKGWLTSSGGGRLAVVGTDDVLFSQPCAPLRLTPAVVRVAALQAVHGGHRVPRPPTLPAEVLGAPEAGAALAGMGEGVGQSAVPVEEKSAFAHGAFDNRPGRGGALLPAGSTAVPVPCTW